MSHHLIIRLAVLLLLLSAAPLIQAEIRPETRWADPSHVLLKVTFPGDYRAQWDVDRHSGGDLFVRADLAVPDEKVSGELVLVERRAVLSRGFGDYEAEAASSLDAAALMLQLALHLLERIEPGGPIKIEKETTLELKEELNPILLDSGNAAGGFQPPWNVYAKLAPADNDGRKFYINFTFTVHSEQGSQKASMRLQGRADFSRRVFPLEGNSGLDEWQLDWRDPGDPAAAAAGQAQTLDELRAAIQAH
jgi:hypothetical protein